VAVPKTFISAEAKSRDKPANKDDGKEIGIQKKKMHGAIWMIKKLTNPIYQMKSQ
jgi:hypothetical protein